VKQTNLVAAALIAGFIGGLLGARVTRAREQRQPEQVVRARSVELVNDAGQTISYWGVDKSENVVLAFGGRASAGGIRSGLQDPRKQVTAIGVIDDSPFLMFRKPGGETRMRLMLNLFAKPVLLMEDETGPRVGLGIEQSDTPGPGDNDWALSFSPERARIGMFTERVGKRVFVRGSFAVHPERVLYPYGQPK
jgi:hypothetical protein